MDAEAIDNRRTSLGRNSSVGRVPDAGSKGSKFKTRQERREIFLSRVKFLC